MINFMIRIFSALSSRWRNLWFSVLGVRFGGYCWLRRISVPRQWGDITLGQGVALDDGVTLLASGPAVEGKIRIGDGVYINRCSILDASEKLEIGDGSMIGPFCYLTDHDHDTGPGKGPAVGGLISRPTRIGKQVWIGAHVTVLKGVSIGDYAVVGAGAVVTKDVLEGVTVAGVPAKVL